MKPTFRLMLAILAGAGLILLLVLVNREASPSAPPTPPTRSAPATRPPLPQADPTRSEARSRPPRVAPQPLSPASVDGDVAEASASSPASVQSGLTPNPTATRVAVGLGGRFVAKPGSKVRIEGTSNVGDWVVEGHIIGGHVNFDSDFSFDPATAQLGEVQAEAQILIPIRSMKSLGRSGNPFNAGMDDTMYAKLLERNIRFTLEELTLTDGPQAEGRPFVFTSKGELMVAGVTNSITMPVEITQLPHDRLKISGGLSVKMTDFAITPPRASWGRGVTASDDVKLSFEWIVGRKPPEPTSP